MIKVKKKNEREYNDIVFLSGIMWHAFCLASHVITTYTNIDVCKIVCVFCFLKLLFINDI